MVPEHESAGAGGELYLVDKPRGWTSFDVVHRLRSALQVRKIGHAGTLDPMATGLLLVCTGRRTKDLQLFAGLEKEYDAEIVLGARTSSFDAETPVIERRSTDDVTEEAVRAALASLVGPQAQVPPMWSAAKVKGKRLYKYARKGQVVDRPAREIVVHAVTPTMIDIPRVHCTFVCSKGTYIRGLADTLGMRLGCGAYLAGLRRTRIGTYRLDDAMSIDALLRQQNRHPA
jgi:tRNA pseudouridine55 synthase